MEAGRLAGLGQEPSADGLAPAWTGDAGPSLELPVYYEWTFRTGERGDFEELVRRLEARVLDERVGIRLMDVSQPGYDVPGLDDPTGLEGALKSLTAQSTPGPDPSFQDELTELVNLPEILRTKEGETAPRVVGPPIYGRWHAARTTVNPDNPEWLNELNLDPRHRAAAGLGTSVVQDRQEQLMASAWQQVGAVKGANQTLYQGQLGMLVSLALYDKYLDGMGADRLITLTDPVHARVTGSATTIRKLLAESPVPLAAVSGAFRRVARPRGRIARHLGAREPGRFVTRLNEGRIAGAGPPPARPDGTAALDDAAERFLPSWVPGSLRRLLPYLPLILYILALLLAAFAALAFVVGRLGLGAGLGAAAVAVAATGTALTGRARRWRDALAATKARLTPDAVASSLPRPDFVITRPGETPPSSPVGAPKPPGADSPGPAALRAVASGFSANGGDSPEAAAFRAAAIDVQRRMHALAVPLPAKEPIDVKVVADKLTTALDPRTTISARILSRIRKDAIVMGDQEDPLEEIMAAPEFPQPMYEPLRNLSQDYLLPGLEHVPNNTIGLLKTNQPFVEAYMVGLNHEMARELLWREYPTDQRGTYFRQFWDVRGAIPPPGADLDVWRESLKDIKFIHTWSDGMGENSQQAPAAVDEHLVLLIRGDLLRKYPTAAIFAEKAFWDAAKERRDRDTAVEPKAPIFRGTLPPDVTFLGFDLTVEEVRGSDDPEKDQGWFFVIQQQHTELRFGLDAADGPASELAEEWSDLSWGHLAATQEAFDGLTFVDLNSALPNTASIHVEQGDPLVDWGEAAADMAHITLQQPVRVAVHGSLMVPEADNDQDEGEG